MKTYLPIISNRCVNEMLAGFNSLADMELSNQHYERLGVDRAFMILCDIMARYGTSSGWRVVDFGCNTGTVSALLTAKGNTVIGVDSFVINVQNLYEDVFQKVFSKQNKDLTFVNKDVDVFLQEVHDSFDFVLLLSIVHHWEIGYARKTPPLYSNKKMKDIFNQIKSICRKAVYLELPDGESYWSRGYATDFISRFFDGWAHDVVGFTVGPNGSLRWLYCLIPLQDKNE